jgi:hypothetical protein
MAGDPLLVLKTEDEAKEIANKREQLHREQGIRTTKHITLDEIGRRLAIGNFKELNLIIKGDVNGSVEALSDSLLMVSKSMMVSILPFSLAFRVLDKSRINESKSNRFMLSSGRCLLKKDLPGAQNMLTRLERACPSGCEELSDLQKSIAEFKAKN